MDSLESYSLGFKSILPIMPSIFLFGLILGITGAIGNVSFFLVASTSIIIFAGSSQLIVIIFIIQNQPIVGIILAGIIINIRHLLYGADLHDNINSKFLKRLFVAYLLTDESFIISQVLFRRHKDSFDANTYHLDEVIIGAGFTLWIFGNIATDLGYLFEVLLKNYFSFTPEFIVSATFVGYFVITWSNSSEPRFNLIIISILAFILSFIFQSSSLIILILLLGMLIGSINRIKPPNNQYASAKALIE